MIVTLASQPSPTSARFTFSGVDDGALAIEVQYAPLPDFDWCVAPIVRTSNKSEMTLVGLNQVCSYYVRGRVLLSTGVVGGWSPMVAFRAPLVAARDTAPAAVMIEPALIVPPEPVLAWAGDNEVAGYPARALGRDDPHSMWWSDRSAGKFGLDMQIAGGPVDTLALLETNASENCTVTVRAGTSAAQARGANPAYQMTQAFRASANLPGRRAYHSLVRLPAPQYFSYWRIEVAGDVPGDRFVATYCVLGHARKSRNYVSDSKSETLLDFGSIERDRSGNPARVRGHRGRSVDFEIQNMLEAQYETAYEQLRWIIGATDPALVVPNSKAGAFLHDRILYGTISAGRATNSYAPRFSSQFTVQSLI